MYRITRNFYPPQMYLYHHIVNMKRGKIKYWRTGERELDELRSSNHHLLERLETLSRSRSSSPSLRWGETLPLTKSPRLQIKFICSQNCLIPGLSKRSWTFFKRIVYKQYGCLEFLGEIVCEKFNNMTKTTDFLFTYIFIIEPLLNKILVWHTCWVIQTLFCDAAVVKSTNM